MQNHNNSPYKYQDFAQDFTLAAFRSSFTHFIQPVVYNKLPETTNSILLLYYNYNNGVLFQFNLLTE